jgi:glucose-6-phosphate 1-dehydrogenase
MDERTKKEKMDENTLPTTIVIFGASGDLAQRKLIPALFSLYRKHRLPSNLKIRGFSRSKWDNEDYRQKMRVAIDKFGDAPMSSHAWGDFSERLSYLPGNFTDPEDMNRLASNLPEPERANVLFYLATPPQFYSEIVALLYEEGLLEEKVGWRRVVLEKPFGTDLESSHALNRALHKVLDERQIYRIDHYLGKETVQNILTFRFANLMYEPIWNRNCIDHVQITVAEEVGLEGRAAYYDGVGVLRDMFQNHLLQLLSLVAMEPPASPQAEDLREEKVKVHRAIRPTRPEEVGKFAVRGQYLGYEDEPGVRTASRTETYAAVKLFVDNERWQGVPFYLRSGKKLKEKCTEIAIQFKNPPLTMFPAQPGELTMPNLLALCLQPDEGIHQRFEVKVPDTANERRSVDMEFHYRDAFGPAAIPEAYERLILDALNGDMSLFTRGDRAELAWELLDPILQAWQESGGPPIYPYEPGCWGPPEADAFLARDGREWLKGCGGHVSQVIINP